ncbi:hypothetical protein N9O29_01515 [Alphaproteobacteria bacterium]|nr:hypothetical protein [Alphaproteobacteria bacterium]
MATNSKYASALLLKEDHKLLKELVDPTINKISGVLRTLIRQAHQCKYGKTETNNTHYNSYQGELKE